MTVACVWVRANVPYKVEYVVNLRAMVRKHLARPHRFVCLTDRPQEMPPTIEAIPIAHDKKLPGWWAKVELFQPDRFNGPVLYLDLDTVIVGDLAPIVDFPATFALCPPGGSFTPRDGRRVVHFGNSSVMTWHAGAADVLYRDFDRSVTDRLWGDQDWIGEKVNQGVLRAATMPPRWFPRLSELEHEPPQPPAKVVLCKKPKNTVAADLYPWLRMAWRAA